MEKRLVVCGGFVRLFVIFVIFRRNPYVFFRHHLQEPTKAQSWHMYTFIPVYLYSLTPIYLYSLILVYTIHTHYYPSSCVQLPEFVCKNIPITRIRRL